MDNLRACCRSREKCRATRLNPEDESNYIDLATLCTNNDAYELGLEVIEVGLHYHPQSERLIFQRGVIEAMTNHFDLADRDFQLASRLAPEKNLSYVGLGVSYLQRGDVQQAIRTLRKRAAEKPNDAILQYLLGEALLRSGAIPGKSGFKEARVALQKSISLNAKFAAAQVDLGKIYLKENRMAKAVQHLEQARALDPKDKGAYSQLAIAYRRMGQTELANELLATLNKLNDEERKGRSRQHLQIVKDESAAKNESNRSCNVKTVASDSRNWRCSALQDASTLWDRTHREMMSKAIAMSSSHPRSVCLIQR